ncbi:PucR family transcriptional regulator [Nocardioides sp. J54]|uniref:PucR family transcriptional regulator n=1 Tax=Nocardioides sp. J54 TaxID=935866 RepID=UPI0004B4C452|nr:helix-turn-helix domain-containing protein [Nocardioides sp. J54]
MRSAADLAAAIGETYVEVVVVGEDRPVVAVDIADAEDVVPAGAGDLALAVGFATPEDVVALLHQSPRVSGLVVRSSWSGSPALQTTCRDLGTTLLALAEGVTWSAAANAFADRIEALAGDPDGTPGAHAQGDLFDLADLAAGILRAPVTIEDAASRVVAYSTGQGDVDAARTASIFGRRVPRHVRDRLRSLGVFKRLAQSSEPFFVPAIDEDFRGRFVVPVRAGGEWLGSVWALADEPREADRELRAVVELVALHLLRMRSRGELAQQLQLDRVRAALQGIRQAGGTPDVALPARVVVLRGPEHDLGAASRRDVWVALVRRHGWRTPAVADLDGRVYAVVADEATGPGSWPWLTGLVEAEAQRHPDVAARAGSAVTTTDDLVRSRTAADEVDALADPAPALAVEDRWAGVVLARAVRGLEGCAPVSPLPALLADAAEPDVVAATLAAVLDHWGDVRAAAAALNVHPNTVRYRMARLPEGLQEDLTVPQRRSALRLELMLLTAAAG